MKNCYRKKPVEIQAWQYKGSLDKIPKWLERPVNKNIIMYKHIEEGDAVLTINTLEGVMVCSVGDYIIKGVRGEFYPCNEEIFKETYEEVK